MEPYLFSGARARIGHKTGQQFGKKAQIIGGFILTLIGLRMVAVHIF
jgi:putative Mn2+ efflux pump MntP